MSPLQLEMGFYALWVPAFLAGALIVAAIRLKDRRYAFLASLPIAALLAVLWQMVA